MRGLTHGILGRENKSPLGVLSTLSRQRIFTSCGSRHLTRRVFIGALLDQHITRPIFIEVAHVV